MQRQRGDGALLVRRLIRRLGGFDSAITLSASLKTATFNPSTIPAPGSGTSTMTITVPKGTATGIYKIQVKGSGDGKSESALVEIDVVK